MRIVDGRCYVMLSVTFHLPHAILAIAIDITVVGQFKSSV